MTEELSSIIESQVAEDVSVLDEKLADYVFFPLSNILRNQPEYPMRLIELTLNCMRNLIQYGWKSKIPLDLAQQLLILLTFIVGGVPGQDRKYPLPEETELEAFKSLSALIKHTGSSAAGAAALVDAKAIPALGHAVSVLLDGIADGRTHEIQLEALQALSLLSEAIKDRSALATFLPGILSSLSKLLTPPKSRKTRREVLVGGIFAVKDVLVKVLGDIQVMGILNASESSEADGDANSDGKVLTPSWLNATSAQVKLALASILKLRNHDYDDVRSALRKLCITLLDECHRSLAESTSILVETTMILSDDHEGKSSVFETSLTDLARVYPELEEMIKSTVYNWVTSLPRLMQSSEERTRQQAFQNLLKGLYFVNDLQLDSTILQNTVAASLRDSSTMLLLGSKSSRVLSELPPDSLELSATGMASATGSAVFQPVLMGHDNEGPSRDALINLVSKIGTVSQQGKLAHEMLDYARESTGLSQVASYWLAFELIKTIHVQSIEVDMFVDFASGAGFPDDSESAFHEVYSFAVAILDSQTETEEVDWRLQALALEVATFTASRLRTDFRAELIDILYPITTFLGSSNSQLRNHAIVALNNMAASCGYPNVTELVIENVDYMVNSVSLRLNTFDISPASTQVLRMMIKLTGPKLIPYLDDVVAAIFAALDNYHGYPTFVENLFSVLIEVVNQGSRSDQLLLEEAKVTKVDHKKVMPQTSSMEENMDTLTKRLEKRKRLREELELEEIGHFPERPWKATKTAAELLDEAEKDPDDESEHHNAEVEKQPPPKTPTFQLLSRITNLTQHYLTSPSPGLRKALLDLLSIVCPALSPDEEAFLPLVNSVWPVLVERLYDPEVYVVVSACRALSMLCQSAGDFLSTRIKTEWWDSLGKWCARAKAEATQPKNKPKATSKAKSATKGDRDVILPIRPGKNMDVALPSTALGTSSNVGLGRFSQAAQTWEAAQGLMISIASFVRIDDAIFDQILDLLADTLTSNDEARSALEALDADAVWLRMYEQGGIEPPPQPSMAGATFVKLL